VIELKSAVRSKLTICAARGRRSSLAHIGMLGIGFHVHRPRVVAACTSAYISIAFREPDLQPPHTAFGRVPCRQQSSTRYVRARCPQQWQVMLTPFFAGHHLCLILRGRGVLFTTLFLPRLVYRSRSVINSMLLIQARRSAP
jgi:hypothetical protein